MTIVEIMLNKSFWFVWLPSSAHSYSWLYFHSKPYKTIELRVPVTMPLSIAVATVFIQLGHSVSTQHYEEDLFQRFVGDQDILLTRGLKILLWHLWILKQTLLYLWQRLRQWAMLRGCRSAGCCVTSTGSSATLSSIMRTVGTVTWSRWILGWNRVWIHFITS